MEWLCQPRSEVQPEVTNWVTSVTFVVFSQEAQCLKWREHLHESPDGSHVSRGRCNYTSSYHRPIRHTYRVSTEANKRGKLAHWKNKRQFLVVFCEAGSKGSYLTFSTVFPRSYSQLSLFPALKCYNSSNNKEMTYRGHFTRIQRIPDLLCYQVNVRCRLSNWSPDLEYEDRLRALNSEILRWERPKRHAGQILW